MEQGHFGRHVRKMRQILGERRNALVDSIRNEFGDMLEVHGSAAGMHVSVTLPAGLDDREIATRASIERLWLWPLSRYYAGKRPRHGFVLGFGSTPAEQIPSAVRHMRALVLG
jgi:GntR family transcriptional regulator/MocR family aminotransferase